MKKYLALALLLSLVGCKVENTGVGGCRPSSDRDSSVRTAYLKSIGRYPLEPGYVVHHIIPLHCGGCDVVGNLTVMEADAHRHLLQSGGCSHFGHMGINVAVEIRTYAEDPVVFIDEDTICPTTGMFYAGMGVEQECPHCQDEIDAFMSAPLEVSNS